MFCTSTNTLACPCQQIAYLVFLCMFTYVVLVKLPDSPHWTEYYTILYITSLMVEKMRQIIGKEPHTLK